MIMKGHQLKKTFNFILFSVLILISRNTFAITSSQCQFQASNYGDGSGKDFIDPKCIDIFETRASTNAVKVNTTGNKKIIGHKNIIFIKDMQDPKARVLIYAGNFTNLQGITAVTFDETNNEIAILDSVLGRVLYFSSIIDGNVSPLRDLSSDLLLSANDLAINPKKDEVIILNNSLEKILVFSRLSNTAGRKNKKKQDLVSGIDALGSDLLSLEIDLPNNQFKIIKKDSSSEDVVFSLNKINQNSKQIKKKFK